MGRKKRTEKLNEKKKIKFCSEKKKNKAQLIASIGSIRTLVVFISYIRAKLYTTRSCISERWVKLGKLGKLPRRNPD